MQRKRIGGRRKKENYFENNAGKNSTIYFRNQK